MPQDYYAVLRLSRQATPAEIRQAYGQLAMHYHPDKNQAPNAQERFVFITQAYYVLSDCSRKTTYDQFLQLNACITEAGSAAPADWEVISGQWEQEGRASAEHHSTYSVGEFSAEVLGDLLAEGLLRVVIDGVSAAVKGTGEALGEILVNIDL